MYTYKIYSYIISMTTINSSRNNYIILSGSNIGAKIYMRSDHVLTNDNGNNDISTNTFFKDKYGSIKYKDRIILSQKLENSRSDSLRIIPTSLITQNNIKNNIKFIHDSNNTNRKILFIKNQDTSDNSNNYLIRTIDSSIITRTTFYHLNYYFNNYLNNIQNYKDYFNIRINDYIYNDSSSNVNKFRIIDFSSNPLFSNTSSDISLINYVPSDFSTLFIDNNSSPYRNLPSDVSISKLNFDLSYSIYNNIHIYNKLTLDFKNVNSYRFALYDAANNLLNINEQQDTNFISYNNSSTINTFMIKTNNFDILNAIKANSKIIFDKSNIYLNNVKTLDICSNFYINNPNYKNSLRLKNTLFLSLGKQITGITQYDLYNNIHIFSKNSSAFDISKIVFSKNISASLITSNNSVYNTLVASVNKDYLLDFTFNYKGTNNNNNINNALNYNISLFNYIEYKNKKQFDFNLSKIIDFSYIVATINSNTNKYYTNNNYINNVNNLLTINNKNLSSIITASYELMNNSLRFKFKDLNYDNTIYRLNATYILNNLYSSIINYDVRYNYGNYFIATTKLDILLQDNSNSNYNLLDLCKNYPFNYPLIGKYDNSYSRINFYSLQVVNLFTLSVGSDFENVDCIFVYHDPTTETDPSFLYPYNNIEIKRDTEIDTLEKAIIVLPGARTSITNSTFIPARNGSNLSRKMIQGLIGMNNVPKLLSIVPYDTNVINGRGFVNQYQIDDTCNDYEAQLQNKINSIKHYSAKDNATTPNNSLKNMNFANVVRSSARSRLSQKCIDNLTAGNTSTTTTTNTPITTPFKLFVRK